MGQHRHQERRRRSDDLLAAQPRQDPAAAQQELGIHQRVSHRGRAHRAQRRLRRAGGAGDAAAHQHQRPCADEIYSVYYNGATTGGKAAFAGWDYRRIEPAYAWAAQLQAGHTPAEIAGFAQSAITAGLAADEGATQTVGTQKANAYVRIYDQIKDLAGVLQKNGFDVWVVSASPQYFVEPFAAMVDIPADHVVGIRMVLEAGKLTSNIQGCGPVADGTNDGKGNVTGNSLITYIDGKRCWVNKAIYGDTTANAVNQNPDKAKRIVFGAGTRTPTSPSSGTRRR